MYDELVKALHEGAEFLECSTPGIKNSFAKMCHNAADAIEELQQIAGHYEETAKDYFKDVCYYLERVPKWISVTERLPEAGVYVLAYSADDDYMTVEARHKFEAFQITHWMPLPEPPKGE